jgi:hypothetical protein
METGIYIHNGVVRGVVRDAVGKAVRKAVRKNRPQVFRNPLE